MAKITLDDSFCKDFYSTKEYQRMMERAGDALNALEHAGGQGSEFTGWHNPTRMLGCVEKVEEYAQEIRQDSEVLLVVGIGGSYLGAKAVMEALKTQGTYADGNLQVMFVGNNISGAHTKKLIGEIRDRRVSVNVISKSGTTTEPAITFRMIRSFMEDKYGGNAKNRIYATTDPINGILNGIAKREGYRIMEIPNDIGGRYSIFTPAGLLPIASAGADIRAFLEGAVLGYLEYLKNDRSIAVRYAVIRNLLLKQGKIVEILASYHPHLAYVTEWWKQLFGESEGKQGMGIFPAGVTFTTDLHSMGQYIQDGMRILFETVLHVENMYDDVQIPYLEHDDDKLNYLSGKTMNQINAKAMEATIQAHVAGGVPNIVLSVPEMNEIYLGMLLYFFMKSCGISGYLLGVNPFDQPGVEEYKRNMFFLLGKEGSQ